MWLFKDVPYSDLEEDLGLGGGTLQVSLLYKFPILLLLLFSLPDYHTIWASTVCRCRVDLRKTNLSLSPVLDIVLTVELHFFISVSSSIKREYSIVTFDGNTWSSQGSEGKEIPATSVGFHLNVRKYLYVCSTSGKHNSSGIDSSRN